MDYLVLWLDCDREGENICFEVIRCVDKFMNHNSNLKQYIYRAKFSAITPKDIEKAMLTLGSPNENESKAVEARQELDLKVGVAFSRFQTQYFQGKYGDLDSSVISYGPCQTPTLGFCVERYDEIQSFTSENFWNIDVNIDIGQAGRQQQVTLEWTRGRIFDQSVAETLLTMIREDSYVLCDSIKQSETRKQRPQPMNTVEMLKLASSRLGIGPHATMKAAEELYLSGYLSYPRTESTSYPASFDIREALNELRSSSDWGGYVTDMLKHGFTSPRSGVDKGDHPPITPVALAVGLTGDKARLYDMIVTHFLATVSMHVTHISFTNF
jgi:DNA topoisomerase-3